MQSSYSLAFGCPQIVFSDNIGSAKFDLYPVITFSDITGRAGVGGVPSTRKLHYVLFKYPKFIIVFGKEPIRIIEGRPFPLWNMWLSFEHFPWSLNFPRNCGTCFPTVGKLGR